MSSFSIVIATKNRPKLVRRAINSCLEQTMSAEIVVVDDGSTDETEQQIYDLKEKVVFIKHQTSRGHSASVNAGVRAARGEWIKFLDDDDYLQPNCIEEFKRVVDRVPNLVLASGVRKDLDEGGKLMKLSDHPSTHNYFYIESEQTLRTMYLDYCPIGVPTQVIANRAAFLESGGWDEELQSIGDDIECWIRLARLGSVAFVNKYIANKISWSGSYYTGEHVPEKCEVRGEIFLKEKIYQAMEKSGIETKIPLPLMKEAVKLKWMLIFLKRMELGNALRLAPELNLSLESIRACKDIVTRLRTRSRSNLSFQNPIEL